MNEQYVQIYINRHENLLFESIRKQIDLETKTLLFESQIKEYQARIEELETQTTSLNEMMVQATNGLSAVTIERDQYKGERDTCDLALADSNRQLNETRVTLQHTQNENANIINENNQLKLQIEALKNDFATQKSNYNLVRNELEERELIISKLKTELEATKLKYESKLVELENKYTKPKEPEVIEQPLVSTKKNLKKKTQGHEWVDGNQDTD